MGQTMSQRKRPADLAESADPFTPVCFALGLRRRPGRAVCHGLRLTPLDLLHLLRVSGFHLLRLHLMLLLHLLDPFLVSMLLDGLLVVSLLLLG